MFARLFKRGTQERARKRPGRGRQLHSQRLARDRCFHDLGNQDLAGCDAANGGFHGPQAGIGKQRAPPVVIVGRHVHIVSRDRVSTGPNANQRNAVPVDCQRAAICTSHISNSCPMGQRPIVTLYHNARCGARLP